MKRTLATCLVLMLLLGTTTAYAAPSFDRGKNLPTCAEVQQSIAQAIAFIQASPLIPEAYKQTLIDYINQYASQIPCR